MTEAASGIPHPEQDEDRQDGSVNGEIEAVPQELSAVPPPQEAVAASGRSAMQGAEVRMVTQAAAVHIRTLQEHYLRRFGDLPGSRAAGIQHLDTLSLLLAGQLHFNPDREFTLEQLRGILESETNGQWEITDAQLARAFQRLVKFKPQVQVLQRIQVEMRALPDEEPSFSNVVLRSISPKNTNNQQ